MILPPTQQKKKKKPNNGAVRVRAARRLDCCGWWATPACLAACLPTTIILAQLGAAWRGMLSIVLRRRGRQVEDVNSIRMLGQRLLHRAGAECSTAADGEQAVAAVRESLNAGGRPFDVVLMDFHMPNMDGVQAMQ